MLSVLTINHNNSDISFLESFTFNKDSLPMALKQLKMINGVDECFILSTCNRVEVYVSSKNKNIDSEIIKFISDFHKISITKKAHYLSCLLYTSPSPRDQRGSGMTSSA